MLFVETTTFTKLLPRYLSDDDYRGLQAYLMEHPDAGAVMKSTGGVRKVRWSIEGKGKSGGVRVIYFWRRTHEQIFMLTIYGKGERANLSQAQRNAIAQWVKRLT
ncbi:MAG: type II toxin-antitoxin system RelE/ParE family toxin [Pseudomonadota bacterium]